MAMAPSMTTLNSHSDSLSKMVVGEGLLSGNHDASPEVTDETEGRTWLYSFSRPCLPLPPLIWLQLHCRRWPGCPGR